MSGSDEEIRQGRMRHAAGHSAADHTLRGARGWLLGCRAGEIEEHGLPLGPGGTSPPRRDGCSRRAYGGATGVGRFSRRSSLHAPQLEHLIPAKPSAGFPRSGSRLIARFVASLTIRRRVSGICPKGAGTGHFGAEISCMKNSFHCNNMQKYRFASAFKEMLAKLQHRFLRIR